MLFANLAKADETLRLLTMKRAIPKPLSTSALAMDQLMDCFVKGSGGSYNKHADYDYLSYFFADLAKVSFEGGMVQTTRLMLATSSQNVAPTSRQHRPTTTTSSRSRSSQSSPNTPRTYGA